MRIFGNLNPAIVAAAVFASLNLLAVLAVAFLGRRRQEATASMRAAEAPSSALAGDMLEALVREVEATESRHWSARGESRLAEDLKRWRLEGGTDLPRAAESGRARGRSSAPRSAA
jgi:hypothetical protein